MSYVEVVQFLAQNQAENIRRIKQNRHVSQTVTRHKFNLYPLTQVLKLILDHMYIVGGMLKHLMASTRDYLKFWLSKHPNVLDTQT